MEGKSNIEICLRYLLENLPTNMTNSKDLSIGSIFVKAGVPSQYRGNILIYLKDTNRYIQSGKGAGTSYRFIPDKDLDEIVEELTQNIKFSPKCTWQILKDTPVVVEKKKKKEKEEVSRGNLIPIDVPLDVMLGQKIYCIYDSEIVIGTLTGINGYYHDKFVSKNGQGIKVPMFRILYQVLIWDDSLEDKLVTLSLTKDQVGITLENLISKLTKKIKR